MKTDIEIAKLANMININEVAKNIGLTEDDYENYGKYKAKINLSVFDKLKNNNHTTLLFSMPEKDLVCPSM